MDKSKYIEQQHLCAKASAYEDLFCARASLKLTSVFSWTCCELEQMA